MNNKLHKTTTPERPPVGSQFFSLKDCIKDGSELQSQTPLTPQPPPPHHQVYPMTPWSLYGGYPNYPFPYGMPPLSTANQQPLGYSPQAYPQQWGPAYALCYRFSRTYVTHSCKPSPCTEWHDYWGISCRCPWSN